MASTLRLATSMSDRAEASRLRRDVAEIYRDRYSGRLTVDDTAIDGHTFLAHHGHRAVGSVDVHWGGDRPLPARRLDALAIADEVAALDARQVVVLDPLIVHPDWADRDVAGELLHAACTLAAERGARFVYSEADAIAAGGYRALGFQPTGSARHTEHGPVVTMRLDLHDRAHLTGVGSPFAALAPRQAAPPAAPPDDAREAGWRQIVRAMAKMREGQAAFLAGLEDSELAKLVVGGRIATAPEGAVLVKEGSHGRDLFLVLEGAVEVAHDGSTLALLGPGEVFGEIGFLLDAVRTATVRAASPTVRVLRISQETLEQLIDAEPGLGARLALGLARALCLKLTERRAPM